MSARSRIGDLDTSFLESDSEDDDDDLLKTYAGQPVFSKKHRKQKGVRSIFSAKSTSRRWSLSRLRGDGDAAPLLKPSLTQSTEGTSSSEEDPSSPRRNSVFTAEQVESKARAAVKDLKLGELKYVCDLADVGWRKTTKASGAVHKKGTVYFYPCVRLSKDRANAMLGGENSDPQRPKRSTKKVGVQYLGWYFKDAWAWEEVTASTFLPLGDDSEENERRLQTFLDQQFGSGEDPSQKALERRTEELVIRACWQRVREQQVKAEAKASREEEHGGCIIDDGDEARLIDNGISSKRLSERSSPNESKEDDDDNSSCDEMDGVGFQEPLMSPGRKRKRLALKPGDQIIYYDQIGIFGDKRWLKDTEILGIDPKRKKFPLNLANGENIPRNQRIRRTHRMHRGTLVEESEGTGFQPVSDFALRTSGNLEKIGFQKEVERIKKFREWHRQEQDDFWIKQKSGDQSNPPTDGPSNEDELMFEAVPPKKSSRGLSWMRQLTKLEEEIKAKQESQRESKRQRYSPKITVEEIVMLRKVCARLQNRMDESQDLNEEDMMAEFADEVDVSMYRLQAIMSGDPDNKLSARSKEELVEALQDWIRQHSACDNENSKTDPVQDRLSRRGAQNPNLVHRRKHFSDEVGRALADLTDDEEGGTTAKRDSQKRRKIACPAKTESKPSGRARRVSGVPSQHTPSKRVARRTYEPPSVKRRKKSLASGTRPKGEISESSVSDSKESSEKSSELGRSERSEGSSASQRQNSKENSPICVIELAKKNLGLCQEEVKKITKNGCKPHMTKEQLNLCLIVWDRIAASGEKVEVFITKLADELELSHRKLVRFVKGDPKPHSLDESEVSNCAQKLQGWLDALKPECDAES